MAYKHNRILGQPDLECWLRHGTERLDSSRFGIFLPLDIAKAVCTCMLFNVERVSVGITGVANCESVLAVGVDWFSTDT